MAEVPEPAFDGATTTALRRRVLRWYRGHRRDLPWRAAAEGTGGRADPYHVLVSEAMLQQTQVATVVPYFCRFAAALPEVTALARASERRVLRLWQGLGYYRRARHLHAAAKRIVSAHRGQVPADVEQLLQLPGVGRYTAGAVASIAFGRRAPILDGNVARVLARWLALAEPIDRAETRRRLWAAATQLVPARSPGDFNQGLMELGALVCTPRTPRCRACPVAALCQGQRAGLADTLPHRTERRTPTTVTHHVVAVSRRGKALLGIAPKSYIHAVILLGYPDVTYYRPAPKPTKEVQWV